MNFNWKKLSRREFLSATAGTLASAGFLSIPTESMQRQYHPDSGATEANHPQYRLLGRTGIQLPLVSLGVMNGKHPEIVQAAYEFGVHHFDTAAHYHNGKAEESIGRVVKNLDIRDNVVIATKALFPNQRRGLSANKRKDRFIEIFEGSLKKLNTDYVDILYLHDVGSMADADDQAVMSAMEKLKGQGKVRAFGVSTHSNMSTVINQVVKTGFYDVVLTAFNLTLADDTELQMAVETAVSKGVGILAMKTLAGAKKIAENEISSHFSQSTITAASIKWVLQHRSITSAVVNCENYEHLRHNFMVANDIELTLSERRFLSDNQLKTKFGFCRQCRTCLASCPSEVEIPTLMRTHMYATQYTDFHYARATLETIPQRNRLEACTTCSECVATCANAVDIPAKIADLKLIYG